MDEEGRKSTLVSVTSLSLVSVTQKHHLLRIEQLGHPFKSADLPSSSQGISGCFSGCRGVIGSPEPLQAPENICGTLQGESEIACQKLFFAGQSDLEKPPCGTRCLFPAFVSRPAHNRLGTSTCFPFRGSVPWDHKARMRKRAPLGTDRLLLPPPHCTTTSNSPASGIRQEGFWVCRSGRCGIFCMLVCM